MTAHGDITPVLRIAWILFSDLSTRLNILSDECAHLQNTIFGLLPHTSNTTLGTAEPTNAPACITERPWVAANPRDSTYHALPNHERALINLWNTVGSLAHGLDAHRLEASNCFHTAIESALDQKQRSESFYWFVAQRGHFLQDVFEFYTRQLQHAHQKLVQLLENMPGSLPNPLLLRRWHSAFYGEFLSEYSRHVNWQTQVLTWELVHGPLSDPVQFDDFRKWRDTSFLTHTWDHIPTSRASRHRIDQGSFGRLPTQFGTVWSSFFYLEQPILFPLLYHECAHFRLGDPLINKLQRREELAEFKSRPKRNGNKFFDARDEAAATLASLVQLEEVDARFWQQFTEEVWADVLSIALGGTGYFSALVLQLFGQCGTRAFSPYEAHADELISIDAFGSRKRQVREVPWPLFHADDHTYFWEARLRVAIEMTRLLHGNSEWLRAISATVDYYSESYSVVFSAESTSQMHESYAQLRMECNEWATDVCLRCLKPHVDNLKAHKDVDDVYRLDSEISKLIARAVTGYQSGVLGNFPGLNLPEVKELKLPINVRLEDLCFLTRWHLSDFVAHVLIENRSADVGRRFVKTYANYMRNDGGTAFRLGLEWCVMRKELYEATADIFKDFADGCNAALGTVSASLQKAAHQDRQIILASGFEEADGAEFLRRKRHLTRENYLPQHRVMSFPFTNDAIQIELTQSLDYFSRHTVPFGCQVRVGTFYLGVLRPWEIAVPNSPEDLGEKGLYARAMEATKAYFATAHEELMKRAYTAADYRHDFAPLVGEYSFLAYSLGVTPVEKDIHPYNVPKHFTKPRFVIEVFRGGRAALTKPSNKDNLLAQSEHELGRITLFRFRYRWQWVEVCKFVNARKNIIQPILLLSSGWEDAILITWHPCESEYWLQHRDLLGILGDDVECQSNAIVPDLLKGQTGVVFPDSKCHSRGSDSVRESWINNVLGGEYTTKKDRPFVEKTRQQKESDNYIIYSEKMDNTPDRHVVDRINRRTGRYDYTIVWKRDGDRRDNRLKDFAEIIQGLPRWFWMHIGRISTSYEERVGSQHDDDGTADSVLVSRILMRSSCRKL